MSAYYKAYYGSWHDTDGIKRLGVSYSFKEIKQIAQNFANKYKETVTIISERGSVNGLIQKFYLIEPEEAKT